MHLRSAATTSPDVGGPVLPPAMPDVRANSHDRQLAADRTHGNRRYELAAILRPFAAHSGEGTAQKFIE